jgi:hypothetical protein
MRVGREHFVDAGYQRRARPADKPILEEDITLNTPRRKLLALAAGAAGVAAVGGLTAETAAATVPSTHFQLSFNINNVPKAGSSGIYVELDATNTSYSSLGRPLPFVVPLGMELRITDVHFATKYVVYSGNMRSSYLVIRGEFTIPDHVGFVSLRTPFVIPGGQELRMRVFNNSPELQNMNGFILGEVVPAGTALATGDGDLGRVA